MATAIVLDVNEEIRKELELIMGTPAKETEIDMNGNVMRYTYDGWQRVATVRSPYDTGSGPAVSYSYGIDGAGRWYAVTDNIGVCRI